MNQDKSQQHVESLANLIINLFYQETNLKPIDVKIEFINDLYQRRLELSNNQKEKNNLELGKEFIQGLNGTMVLPTDVNGTPHILISNSKIDDSGAFLGTIIHELTHIHDFHDFVKHVNYNSFFDAETHKDFPLIYQWSEYHARRTGYFFYRKAAYLIIDDISTEEQLEHIKGYECSFQLEILRNQLNKYENNATLFIYSIMQFLGRFSVWQDLFPNYINVNLFPRELLLTFGERITNLYEFLYNNITFNDVKNKFSDLDILLKQFIK